MRKLYYILIVCLAALLSAILVWWYMKPDTKTKTLSSTESPANAPAAKAAAAGTAAPAAVEPTDEQLLTQVGWFMVKRFQLTELGFNHDEAAAIVRGVTLSLEGKDSPLPIDTAGPKMSAFMQKRMQVTRANAQKAAQATEATYFANLKSKGISSTPSGLYYEIIQPGSEKKPTPTDSVMVNYTGRLTDGKVFDSSNTPGKPATLQMNRVIRGWTEGLQLIGVGGKIKLYVPFSLAYGPGSQPKIPAFSTLEFEIELLGVTPAPVHPAPGAPRPPIRTPAAPAPGIGAPASPAPATPAPASSVPASPAPASPAPVNSAY